MRISDWSSDVGSSDRRLESGVSRACQAPRHGRSVRREHFDRRPDRSRCLHRRCLPAWLGAGRGLPGPAALLARSEEHTSELQSLMRISYAVFCLKKNNSIVTTTMQCTHNSYHNLFFASLLFII